MKNFHATRLIIIWSHILEKPYSKKLLHISNKVSFECFERYDRASARSHKTLVYLCPKFHIHKLVLYRESIQTLIKKSLPIKLNFLSTWHGHIIGTNSRWGANTISIMLKKNKEEKILSLSLLFVLNTIISLKLILMTKVISSIIHRYQRIDPRKMNTTDLKNK